MARWFVGHVQQPVRRLQVMSDWTGIRQFHGEIKRSRQGCSVQMGRSEQWIRLSPAEPGRIVRLDEIPLKFCRNRKFYCRSGVNMAK